ncbi:MAG: site-2 protease family protein [candidate division Zixibacteria bacterium]|nr:site-2 protease family protein [candidate division Zixibacteria bacterium]
MKKADLQRIARETGASLSDILEIQTVYNDGNDIVFLGRPKIFPAEFKHEAATRLTNLGYRNEIYDGDETITLKVITGAKVEPKVPWLNMALFLATVVSTMITGAMYYNVSLDEMMSHPIQILKGWPYSFWLLAILGFHEFGHYLTARYRKVKVTLPYFIPAPTMLGTLGAFIRLKSPLKNRGELLEVGAMGPVAGFVVSIIAIVIGLKLSTVVPEASSTGGMILGDSLLFTILSKLVVGNLPQGMTIMLDPVAFAGWVGLLVTMLNMLPLGQLDGGHILYAMFGRRQFLISRITMLALVAMAVFLWTGWGVWVIFGFLMRPNHPPTLNDSIPLTYNQKLLGWFAILIFALCFIPVPIT